MTRDKASLKEKLLAALRADLSVLEKAQAAAQQGATHEEAKPENDKDTRAIEASYLARGQALRVRELQDGIRDVEATAVREFKDAPAALGALIEVDQEGEARSFFLAACGGGLVIDGVNVVTPKSPLGRAFLGAHDGDDREVTLAGKVRTLSIITVK